MRLHYIIGIGSITISVKMAEVEARGEINRRRSSGGIRRNASHDISDQIENKLADLKKVHSQLLYVLIMIITKIAKDESSFTEEGDRTESEPNQTERSLPIQQNLKDLKL